MKVLYKNKVGSLVPIESFCCNNYIYSSKHVSVSHCRKIGLMELCGALQDYEFILSSSDVLTYEN